MTVYMNNHNNSSEHYKDLKFEMQLAEKYIFKTIKIKNKKMMANPFLKIDKIPLTIHHLKVNFIIAALSFEIDKPHS